MNRYVSTTERRTARAIARTADASAWILPLSLLSLLLLVLRLIGPWAS